MRSASRRSFLSRAFQTSTGAALATMAGCLGSGGNSSGSTATEELEAIEDISFSGTEMKIGFSKNAVGKTINLLPPNSDEPLKHWNVDGSRKSVRSRLLDSNIKGTVPISSGEYTLEVVENTEVINERAITLKPDLRLVSADVPDNSSGVFNPNIKFRNRGTLPAGIESASVPSGAPATTDESSMGFSRIDSTASNLQNVIKIGEGGTFHFKISAFRFNSEKEMHNYTVGNSSLSSRECDVNQRQATLVIITSQGTKIKQPFTYSLSGYVRASGLFYRCSNTSYSISTDEHEPMNSTQTDGE